MFRGPGLFSVVVFIISIIERPETEILVLSLFLMRFYAGICIIYWIYASCMSALVLFSFTITKLNMKMA